MDITYKGWEDDEKCIQKSNYVVEKGNENFMLYLHDFWVSKHMSVQKLSQHDSLGLKHVLVVTGGNNDQCLC